MNGFYSKCISYLNVELFPPLQVITGFDFVKKEYLTFKNVGDLKELFAEKIANM